MFQFSSVVSISDFDSCWINFSFLANGESYLRWSCLLEDRTLNWTFPNLETLSASSSSMSR